MGKLGVASKFLNSVMVLLSFQYAAAAQEGRLFQKRGVANCTLPGTELEFYLNGKGGAELAKLKTNYAPIREAGKVKTWAVSVRNMKGKQLLIIDNLRNTRIMVDLKEGRGIAFTDPGASDILCQILLSP